jgi:Methyltransferase domain
MSLKTIGHSLLRKGVRLARQSELVTRLVRDVRPSYREISDEYVRWLTFANVGMLNSGNLYCFDHAIKNLPGDLPMVEIGSFCGLSTNLIAHYLQVHGRNNTLFTCDAWLFEGAGTDQAIPGSSLTYTDYRTFVRESFLRNVRMFSRDRLPHTIEKLSGDFFAAWRRGDEVQDVFGRQVRLGGRLGFVYIDGDHSYAGAKLDFEQSDEFLASGGFMLFDDSADGSGWDVCRVIDEVKSTGRYEVVVANPNYLFRKL